MAHFFSQKSTFDTSMQVINAGAAVFAMTQIIMEPSTSWRFSFDLLTHVLSFIALRDKDNFFTRCAVAGVNCARMGAIYADATGQRELGIHDVLDLLFHGINAPVIIFGTGVVDDDDNTSVVSVSESSSVVKSR